MTREDRYVTYAAAALSGLAAGPDVALARNTPALVGKAHQLAAQMLEKEPPEIQLAGKFTLLNTANKIEGILEELLETQKMRS